VLWNLPSKFLTSASAAAGLAAINSVGNLGDFIAQNVVPWIRDATGSTIAPMLFLAACLAAGGLMTFFVQAAIRRPHPEVAVAKSTNNSGLFYRSAPVASMDAPVIAVLFPSL
jgi:nitrate/nitrite transporter NarK